MTTKTTTANVDERFWARVDKSDGCWVWTGSRTHTGYGHVAFGGKILATHRLAWELTHGPVPVGLHVLHRCDNPACVRPDHLFLGTHTDNMQDAAEKRRLHQQSRPESTNTAVLTPQDVAAIVAMMATGLYRQAEIARMFGVSRQTINHIAKGRTWCKSA